MDLTRPQLADLIGRDYTWLDTRIRRARADLVHAEAEVGGVYPRTDAARADIVPLRDIVTDGKWARFDAADAVNMAVAVELEDAGVTFRAATKIALNTSASQVIAHPPSYGDLWIAVVVDRDKDGVGRSHRVGTLTQIAEAISAQQAAIAQNQQPEEITTVITLNASAVLRRLQARARTLGLSAALGWR